MTKKKVLIGLGALGAVIIVATAAAYFSGVGSTTASAHTGSAPNLIVTSSAISGDKYPGDTFPVDLIVTNNSGHASGVGVIKLASVDAPVGCDPSWFTAPNVPGGGALANGASQNYTANVTFEDTGSPQDDCTSQDIVLHFSVTPS